MPSDARIAMRKRDNFKSQLISRQKPRKRRSRPAPDRDGNRIDLIQLHKDLASSGRSRGVVKAERSKGWLFALLAVLGFFALGYLIAALSIAIWIKIVFFVIIAIVGFVSSYLVVSLFH